MDLPKDMEYKEMTSPDFRVYFDSKVPEEGAMAMQSLTTVKPMMEKWMGISRDLDDSLRVVMSNEHKCIFCKLHI